MKPKRNASKPVDRQEGARSGSATASSPTTDVDALIAAAIDDHPHAAANDLTGHASSFSLRVNEVGQPDPEHVALAKPRPGKREIKEKLRPAGTVDAQPREKVDAGKPARARRRAPALAPRLVPRRDVAPEPIAIDPPAPPVSAPAPVDRVTAVAIASPEHLPAAADDKPAAVESMARGFDQPAAASGTNPGPIPTAAADPTRETADISARKPGHAQPTQPAATFQPRVTSPTTEPGQAPDPDMMALPDMESMARNMGKFIEYSGKAVAAYLEPRETGAVSQGGGEEVVETMNSLGRIAESWMANPAKMLQAQAALSTQLFSLWTGSFGRFGASKAPETATPVARKTDKRFAAPEWQNVPVFDFLHQAYLATIDWAKAMVADAEGVDDATREKAAFYLRQISSALSPSNFLATNPELIRETFKEKGENLVRGMQMLAEDISAGKGDLKIRQSDASKFTLGVDMASTPGKVVFRNALMELIQYAPATEVVLKRPLLIVPPWINKFYVLDLNKDKSFIGWIVSQGVTVFVISWVNPDERHAEKDWNAYMGEGIFTALDAIETATGETDVSTVGYCVGGTLLAATLAYMAAKGDRRVTSSTFLTTQVDFKDAGDLKVFADEAQIRAIEKQMKEGGYLAGSKMANAFNMLRPDDLIWSYSVNTYIKGKAPAPFDLLAWNADSTRMSAANHAFYLRNCYLENNLTKGEMVIGGEKLNLGLVTIPIYDLAAREDHIAPARSVFTGAKFFGGPVRYVLAGSGHIAGVVNPPSKAKYQFWTGGRMDGRYEDWLDTATEIKGTWWLDWIEWLRNQAPETVPARTPGGGGLQPLCNAPGEYVRVQS